LLEGVAQADIACVQVFCIKWRGWNFILGGKDVGIKKTNENEVS
jgi:hypothetical protein